MQMNIIETKHKGTPWFVDLGASHYVSGKKQVFTAWKQIVVPT